MHKKAAILLNWEFETIDYYFQNGLNYYLQLLDKEISDKPRRIIGENDFAIGSFKYFRRSVLYELNALVEEWLLIASTNGGDFFDKNNLKRTRADSVKTIRQKYNIEFYKITGFKDVEQIRRTVNSLKHRGGFDFTDYSKGITELKLIKDDIEYIRQLKDSTFKVLKELIDMIVEQEKSSR